MNTFSKQSEIDPFQVRLTSIRFREFCFSLTVFGSTPRPNISTRPLCFNLSRNILRLRRCLFGSWFNFLPTKLSPSVSRLLTIQESSLNSCCVVRPQYLLVAKTPFAHSPSGGSFNWTISIAICLHIGYSGKNNIGVHTPDNLSRK